MRLCHQCVNFDEKIEAEWQYHLRIMRGYINLLEHKKNQGKGDFDCIIGLSGGLDSSYVAHIAVKVMGSSFGAC